MMNDEMEQNLPLYAQIASDIRRAIASGELQSGARLPAVTDMAETRGVTAATIRRALKDLTDEGLVYSHVGRGTFITEPEDRQSAAPAPAALGSERSRTKRADAERDLRELMNLANRPGVIAFTRGIGDPETIEKGTLTRLAHEALEGGEEMFLDYGDPRGLLPLREAIANLYREQGIDIGAEHVLVTSGSQQALALIAREAAENGTPVACEIPCYSGVMNAFEAFGVQPSFIERDADGPKIDRLSERGASGGAGAAAVAGTAVGAGTTAAPTNPGIFYLCPILHNPMGTDISPERQCAAAEWSQRTGGIILADEIYRDLHLGPDTPESFLANPGPEHAIILGSLSKSFISGLRVGWLITSEERIRSLTAVKKAMDLGCPPLMQGIARVFLEDETGYKAHKARVREHYRIRRDAVLAALKRHMPGNMEWTEPAGGFQLWITLPAGCSAVELLVRAVNEGVSFLPGTLQATGDSAGEDFSASLRLCYGSLKPEEIEEGIRRLARATDAYLTESSTRPVYSGMGDF